MKQQQTKLNHLQFYVLSCELRQIHCQPIKNVFRFYYKFYEKYKISLFLIKPSLLEVNQFKVVLCQYEFCM